jgi:predicted nucleic acid-binding protein
MRHKQRSQAAEVTLTDTGPLVGLVDKNDPHHQEATAALKRLRKVPLLTTWPCLTEAMYLLYQAARYPGQEALWRFVESGALQVHSPGEGDWRRMRELMAVFQDAPMDMADASVIAAAEALNLTRVFTYDRHFFAYRLANGDVLEVVQ